jgi:hypothetical protein
MKTIKTRTTARRTALAVALLTVACSGIATAQILECVDAKGRKEFANQCPPGTTEARKIMKSGVGTPSSGAGAAAGAAAPAPANKSVAEQEADFRKRQNERQENDAKATKDKAEAEDRRRQCEQSQTQLKALESGQRMGKFDSKTGERTILTDSERAGEIDQARKAVQTWCK